MARLTLVRAVPVRPPEVVEAYRAWMLSDRWVKPGEGARTSFRTADGGVRFTRTGKTRSGAVRVDGFVTFVDATHWECRRETEVNGVPYARESERYFVAERPEGADLTVDFELHARSPLLDLLLGFGRGRLLLERSRELDRWLPAHASDPTAAR